VLNRPLFLGDTTDDAYLVSSVDNLFIELYRDIIRLVR